MLRPLLIALCLAPFAQAQALDYRSLSDNAVVLDAGSRQANPQFILLRGTPVELLVTLDRWAKVREAGGGIGWVDRSLLVEQKRVIVTAPNAEIRQAASPDSALLFTASKDVVLELLEKTPGPWLKVRHRDGRVGFVELKAVWGG